MIPLAEKISIGYHLPEKRQRDIAFVELKINKDISVESIINTLAKQLKVDVNRINLLTPVGSGYPCSLDYQAPLVNKATVSNAKEIDRKMKSLGITFFDFLKKAPPYFYVECSL